MIKSILSTLSDTEVISIAEELNNSEIKISTIVDQLISKSNESATIISQIEVDGLPKIVAAELASRLRMSNSMRCKCD